MAFKITFDHLDNTHVGILVEEMPLYGIERVAGVDPSLPVTEQQLLFRLYDDDGTLCYTGWAHDDDEAVNQSAALRWGETDAGCTVIKVSRNREYVQEIA